MLYTLGSSVSTTVEITIGYLTIQIAATLLNIYNSRNYYRLLNIDELIEQFLSTTVEITIGYLTACKHSSISPSTTVEITIGYLTGVCLDFDV